MAKSGAAPKRAKARAPRVSDNVRKLAGGKKKGAPAGSNSGDPIVKDIAGLQVVGKADEEAFLVWQNKIKRQREVWKKAKKLAKDESDSLGGLFTQAKEAGIPAHRLSALKKLFKLEDRSPQDVAAEHKEMAWQAAVTKSPTVQLGLFDLKEPTLEGYEMLGEKAGMEGQPMDNAPGKPSEDKHARWVTGWKRGQKKLAESTFNPSADKGEGDEATTRH